ncbi:hypothetical protein K435DRAFT_853683 [Dendrothele bispora CBS 962.96]|uniref:Uncharacterized protein n=1 Tax=Dendrothele bispora (strain CBS 962.96) TaxID=1314807 RepID=A0A4S8MH16_DENBC|nr:hypothetical protein K435DRAFT_853683 [Dendrothele bispora CBS 962.96]
MPRNSNTEKKKTGRRGWYHGEVETWLLEFFDECRKCKNSGKADVFYTARTRELYLKYPAAAIACAGSSGEIENSETVDPTSSTNLAQSQDEADFIKKKKTEFAKCRFKVGEFYRRKIRGGTNSSDKVLDRVMESTVPSKPQKLTVVQMFGKLYRESLILPVVEKEWKKACEDYEKATGVSIDPTAVTGTDSPNDESGAGNDNESGLGDQALAEDRTEALAPKKPVYIALYNRIVKDLFEKQSEEMKQHVAEEVERAHKEGLDNWQAKKDVKLNEEKSLEELEITLNKLGVAACRFVNATASESKCMVSIVFIGPNGRDGGNIELKWVHVGSTAGGLIWPEYDPKAFTATEQSLVRFGNQCFNAETRAARAIQTSVPMPATSDEPSWTVARNPTEVAASIIRNKPERHRRPGPGRNSEHMVKPPKSTSSKSVTKSTAPPVSTSSIPRPRPRPCPKSNPTQPLPESNHNPPVINTPEVQSCRRAVSMDPSLDVPIIFPEATKAYRPLLPTPSSQATIPIPLARPRSSSDAATAIPDLVLFPRLQKSVLSQVLHAVQNAAASVDADQSGSQTPHAADSANPNGEQAPHDDGEGVDINPDLVWNHPCKSEFWPVLQDAVEAFEDGAEWPMWPDLVSSYLELEEHFNFQEKNGKFSTKKESPAIKIFKIGNGDPSEPSVLAARAKFPKAWQAWWSDIVPDEGDGFYPLDTVSGSGGLYKLILGLFWWGVWVYEEEDSACSQEEKDLAGVNLAEWMQSVEEMQEMITSVMAHLKAPKGKKRKMPDAKRMTKKRKTDLNETSVRRTQSHKHTEVSMVLQPGSSLFEYVLVLTLLSARASGQQKTVIYTKLNSSFSFEADVYNF